MFKRYLGVAPTCATLTTLYLGAAFSYPETGYVAPSILMTRDIRSCYPRVSFNSSAASSSGMAGFPNAVRANRCGLKRRGFTRALI
jgi:hypothetical protein